MAKTAAAPAPASMPMMSGLANGLRARLWKMEPETPKAAPTSRPVRARGRRSVRTMKPASSLPAPTRAATTSLSGIGEVADADRDAEDGDDGGAHGEGDGRRAGRAATGGATRRAGDGGRGRRRRRGVRSLVTGSTSAGVRTR